MPGREKSDSAIVAGKPTNKAVPTAAEPVERRAGAKGNASQQSTHRTQRRVRVSQALERVRQVSPSHTQGGSRVREFRSHGSGRGAVSNCRPYRTSMRVLRISTHKRQIASCFYSITPLARARSCSGLQTLSDRNSTLGSAQISPLAESRWDAI